MVISVAVIEHAADIQKFINKLMTFGHSKSTIAIMTINESGIIYSVAKFLKFLEFPPTFNRLYSKHHLNHLTIKSLRKLIENAGLKVISHKTHNSPLASDDFSSSNPFVDSIRLFGGGLLFCLAESQKGFPPSTHCM